jgi:hypothetical protein
MRIPKQVRETISLTTQLLEEHEIEWQIELFSKHYKLVYWIGGKSFCSSISKSASDNRSRMNLRSDVMKIIKQHKESK